MEFKVPDNGNYGNSPWRLIAVRGNTESKPLYQADDLIFLDSHHRARCFQFGAPGLDKMELIDGGPNEIATEDEALELLRRKVALNNQRDDSYQQSGPNETAVLAAILDEEEHKCP